MKRWLQVILVLGFIVLLVADVDARGRRRRGRSYSSSPTGSHMDYTPTAESTDKLYHNGTLSLQDIATMRAKWMAHYGAMTHSIHTYNAKCPTWTGLGVSEGIGCSTTKDYKRCSTCITGRRVVADGHCRGKNGMVYRVRFFRN